MKAVEIGMKHGALAMIISPSDKMLFSTGLLKALAKSIGIDQTLQQPVSAVLPDAIHK